MYSSTNVIGMVKSRRTTWAEHVAYMEERCIPDFGGET